MAYTPINLGTAPTGSDGDAVRAAFVKVNYLLNDMTSGNAGTPKFALSDVAANWRGIRWATSGSPRFDMMINGGAETGSNANSNLYLRRFDDNGSFVSDVFNVNRATGLMTFTSPIALLGALNSSAKVNAINAANQVINGSGELGDAGWNTANFVSQKMGGSFARDQFCFKNAAALSADTYDFQPTIPCAAGVPLCLQAEMATWGMTKGSVVCGVNFLNSSGTQVGNLFVTSNGYGNDFAYATATGVAPAGTVSIQPFKGAWGTPAVTAGGCAVRRIKVEKGTQPSLYSQEASIAYLQGSPALSGRPTFAGETPWDSGNLKLASPPAWGANVPNTGRFTTVTATSGITSGGSASGVAGSYSAYNTSGALVASMAVSLFGGDANSFGIHAASASGTLSLGAAGAEQLALLSTGRFYTSGSRASAFPQVCKFNILFNGSTEYGMQLQTQNNNTNAITFANASGIAVGSVTIAASGTSFNTTSDYRLKQNYVPIEGADEKLLKVQFYEGEYIANPGVKEHYAIAHELQEHARYAVTGEKDAVGPWRPVYREGFDPDAVEEVEIDGQTVAVRVTPGPNDVVGAVQDIIAQGVDYSKLVPLLGAALQCALKRIAALEERPT